MGELMFGVVLWSDSVERKAVFWCEDQGDLAFFDETAYLEESDKSGLPPAPFFNAGDMVQFDIAIEARLRKAQNPRIVVEKACRELPTELRKTSASRGAESAKIIPFSGAPDIAASGKQTAIK